MLTSTSDQALLKQIRSSVSEILTQHTNARGDLELSHTMRLDVLRKLIGFSKLIPHPGEKNDSVEGQHSPTLTRWQVLAFVAGIDLTIAKWFESHLDALSILREIGVAEPLEGLWAVWAAEGMPLNYQHGQLEGFKAWCSGANIVDYGLMTYRDAHHRAQLVIVDMQQDGIAINGNDWAAVGMQPTDTATIHFEQVKARQVGSANAYLDRAGFWHGAAGVAACWYGASARLASYLVDACHQKPNDFKAMYLGQISAALAMNRQYFYALAHSIDRQPNHSHELTVSLLRANIVKLAQFVIDLLGQALGASPFCANAHFARLAADLGVFIRQSHGAFDDKRIGELTKASFKEGEILWPL